MTKLIVNFPDSSIQGVSDEMLQITSEVQDEISQVNILARIAISSIEPLKLYSVAARFKGYFLEFQDQEFKVKALTKLIPNLSGASKQEALHLA